MKAIIICDSFKGTASSKEVNALIKDEFEKRCPTLQTETITFADGGEGFLESIKENLSDVKELSFPCFDSQKKEKSIPCLISNHKAYIEIASLVGLKDVEGFSSPLTATTFGIGQLLQSLCSLGIRDFIIGLGGSATNDMGAGLLAALGYHFYIQEKEVFPYAYLLKDITKIEGDLNIPDGLTFTLFSDVTSPLLGKEGATYTFARQKGATEEELPLLEESLSHLHDLLEKKHHIQSKNKMGSGAAGGLGAVFYYLGETKVINGAQGILNLCHFEDKIKNCDFVITGEGKLDFTSLKGKALSQVTSLCQKNHIPFAILCGRKEEGIENAFSAYPLLSIIPFHNQIHELSYLQEHLERDVRKGVEKFLNILKNTPLT